VYSGRRTKHLLQPAVTHPAVQQHRLVIGIALLTGTTQLCMCTIMEADQLEVESVTFSQQVW